ncbi:MAG: TldD/PmbA family protein [Bryobacteraceae bacterium]
MLDLAQQAIRLALDQGATGAECTIAEGDEFSANVRMRHIETLKEAGSRAAGLRVIAGKRVGSSYTSDLSAEGIRAMVKSAIEIARISTEDPHAGLPDPSELGAIDRDLQMYSDDVATLETDYKIQQAMEAEEAAFQTDARITNSEGASFDSHLSRRFFANSLGFAGSYRSSSCSLTAIPVAQQGDSMERDYWYSVARSSARLEPPQQVGRLAAERAVRRLGARKIPTQKAAVIFEPRTARGLLDHIFDAIDGESIYRKASFLAGKLGQKIAAESITIIDDGTIPGLFGSAPFDDEGVPSRRTVVIERGVLRNYLLNTYTARKLGLKTTGNASRGITGNASVGNGNFYLEKGDRTPEQIVQSVKKGLYVTELIGTGVNTVTGDYSRGAVGMWIENGEFAYPVAEITIAANLREMLMDIEYIGNDLEFRASVAAPTIMIGEMTISGQ